jgi:hypothetical protein
MLVPVQAETQGMKGAQVLLLCHKLALKTKHKTKKKTEEFPSYHVIDLRYNSK